MSVQNSSELSSASSTSDLGASDRDERATMLQYAETFETLAQTLDQLIKPSSSLPSSVGGALVPRPQRPSAEIATASVCGDDSELKRSASGRTDRERVVVAAAAAAHSLLSDRAILQHMASGTVVIEPFVRANLATSSYDVTLGANYYREVAPQPGASPLYNPYSTAMVQRVWGAPLVAGSAAEWCTRSHAHALENIAPDDRIIVLAPGETILAHTNEFIGGRVSVTTMMKARSSLGRNFIQVCKCAGWGDIGYVNRWTMEITNNSRHYSIPLVVGRRVAQIVFFDTCGTAESSRSYVDGGGKYQTTANLDELRRAWQPTAMLPKLYLDREAAVSAAVEGKQVVTGATLPMPADSASSANQSRADAGAVAVANTRPVPRWATKLAGVCATVDAHSYLTWIALVASAPFSDGSATIVAAMLIVVLFFAVLAPVVVFSILLANSIIRVWDRVCVHRDDFGEAWRRHTSISNTAS